MGDLQEMNTPQNPSSLFPCLQRSGPVAALCRRALGYMSSLQFANKSPQPACSSQCGLFSDGKKEGNAYQTFP